MPVVWHADSRCRCRAPGGGRTRDFDLGKRRRDVALAVHYATVTREALRGRATKLLPILKARAERAEQLRQLPPETVQDLIDSELIRL